MITPQEAAERIKDLIGIKIVLSLSRFGLWVCKGSPPQIKLMAVFASATREG
jgi:hypothetical protein